MFLDCLGRWRNQSCQIFFSIGSLGCLWQGVRFRLFQCKPYLAITAVVLPYNCDWWVDAVNIDTKWVTVENKIEYIVDIIA